MVRAGFEVDARGCQRRMTLLVLEIACGYSVIEVPDGKAVPEQRWMDAMPILAYLVLALDLLLTGPGSDVVENILNLS